MFEISYVRLIRRAQAVSIDSVVLPIAVISSLILGDAFGVSHLYAKVVLILLPILIFEPGLVSFTGGTIGHHLTNIRITKMDGQRNINFFAALLRFLIKWVFGGLSLIFVFSTKRHQALHDVLSRSLAVHKNPSRLPDYERLQERVLHSAEFLYPPAWRRVLVIFIYWVITIAVQSFIARLVVTSGCMDGYGCSAGEDFLFWVLDLTLLMAIGVFTTKGWRGKLYGCRRRPRLIEKS